MIAVIVCGIIFIGLLLSNEFDDETDKHSYLIYSIIFLLNLGVLIGSLGCGYMTTPNLSDKQLIEELLIESPNSYIIEEAKKYNESVQFGNNYWCRFTIDNREMYLIDIDNYIK